MSNYDRTYRIHGGALDVQDGFVDVTVANYDPMAEMVNLTEPIENGRSFEMSTSDFEDLKANKLLASHEDLTDPSHNSWGVLDSIRVNKFGGPLQDSDTAVESVSEQWFRTIVTAMT